MEGGGQAPGVDGVEGVRGVGEDAHVVEQWRDVGAADVDGLHVGVGGGADVEGARVAAHPRRPLVEASGGITLARVATLAAAGVDVISVGSLTHGARAIDIGLDFVIEGQWTT